MHFRPIIALWAVRDPQADAEPTLAADLGLPTKNVRRWVDNDSIPADWFAAVARAARRRGITGVSERSLAAAAEARRKSRLDEAA